MQRNAMDHLGTILQLYKAFKAKNFKILEKVILRYALSTMSMTTKKYLSYKIKAECKWSYTSCELQFCEISVGPGRRRPSV